MTGRTNATDSSTPQRSVDRWRAAMAAAAGASMLLAAPAWMLANAVLPTGPSDAATLTTMLALAVVVTLLDPRGHGPDAGAAPPSRPALSLYLSGAAALVIGLYAVVFETAQIGLAAPGTGTTLVGVATLVAVTVATLLRLGPVMPGIVLGVAVLVLWVGPGLPPRIATLPISAERLVAYLAFDNNGLLSRLLYIAFATIAPFVIFGTLFARLGADRAIADPLMHLMRNCVGGPSKAAVLSSSCFGLVSGSAVANVSTSAPITVPMMLRDRMTRAEAAGIEAVASSVGQVLPPVLGASAFVMAEWLALPYREIALGALAPSLLSLVFLVLLVDLDARRRAAAMPPGQRAAHGSRQPSWTLAPGPLARVILPLLALGAMLFHGGIPAGQAALLATAVVMGLHLGWPGPVPFPARCAQIRAALRAAVPSVAAVTLLAAMAAILMALLQVTGASFVLTQGLMAVSQGNYALLGLLTGVLVLFLGMGMPTVGVYVLAASLCAPILVEAGTVPIAAHLFILFMGMLSMVTPPVAMATLTAAMAADAPFWGTCRCALRYAVGLMLMAAVILIQPALVAPLTDPLFIVALPPLVLMLALVAAALAGHVGIALSGARRVLMGLGALICLSAVAAAEIGMYWWLTLGLSASLLAAHTQWGQRVLASMTLQGRTS